MKAKVILLPRNAPSSPRYMLGGLCPSPSALLYAWDRGNLGLNTHVTGRCRLKGFSNALQPTSTRDMRVEAEIAAIPRI